MDDDRTIGVGSPRRAASPDTLACAPDKRVGIATRELEHELEREFECEFERRVGITKRELESQM